MKFKLIVPTLLLLSLTLAVSAQVPMGGWRTHFAYNEVSKVEQAGDKVFAISDGALFSVEKDDGVIDTYSKINGLSDLGIVCMNYDTQSSQLLVAYLNGNIDLIKDDDFYNIPDFKNKAVTSIKVPNDICFNAQYAYISCGVGIVVIDMNKREVTDTYIIGNNSSYVNVLSTAFLKDSIYAITQDGMYSALTGSKFLADYNNWKFRPMSGGNKQLLSFNNQLFLLKNNGDVQSSNDAQNWNNNFNNGITGMHISDNNLILYSENSIWRYDNNMALEQITNIYLKDAVYNNQTKTYWIAGNANGLQTLKDGQVINSFKPEGPYTNKIFTLRRQGNRMFALTGAPRDIFDQDREGAIMILENNSWKNITRKDVNLTDPNDIGCKTYKYQFIGLTQIGIDPNDTKHYFVTSWREGMYEFKNDVCVKRYNQCNSPIEVVLDPAKVIPGDYNNTDGAVFDKNGSLWINNMIIDNCIKVMSNTGVWTGLAYAELKNHESFDNILITNNNYKWLNLVNSGTQNGGIFVLNDNNNPSAPSTHTKRLFISVTDQDGENISTCPTGCLVQDKDNNVWAGTDMGPIIFKNINNVFNSDYTVNRPKITRNDGSGFADYLLNGVAVKTIAVDGSNRKWIGTKTSGAYLVSADGLETIQHFTAENSPLLSNSILSIDIDESTGEVFFATNLGLISYKSDSSEGKKTLETLSIYPNPVRENFQGAITFTGFMTDSSVKVTDMAGHIVYETTSNGGMATWNGITKNGKRAASGVYFVMAAAKNSSGETETTIGKFLIVK